MKSVNLQDILQEVARGSLSPEDARIRVEGQTRDLDPIDLDFGRLQRCGVPEVIYAAGKTPAQIREIIRRFMDRSHPVFATRVLPEVAEALVAEFPDMVHHVDARCLTLDSEPLPPARGSICVVSAGTSDEPVAAEAALTAERMGAAVTKIGDVGVAGLHRVMARIDEIRQANVVIVVAGMEGALPSVVGGLIDRPLVAVPTSVGYGANMEGLTPFLAMLNSCVAGLTVVNIDNGFGAGVAAGLINRAIVQAAE